MNKLVIASLLALSFATGFTCSKNAPEQAAAPTTEQAPAAAPTDAAAAPAPTDAAAPAAAPAPSETK